MLKFFLFLSIVSGINTFSQNITLADTIKYNSFQDLEKKTFYGTDYKNLKYYIRSSEKPYKLIFTFTDWCKPCREKHPSILEIEKKFKNKLDVIFVTDIYTQGNLVNTYQYLSEINNNASIFTIIDDKKFEVKKGKYKYFLFDNKKNKRVQVNRYEYTMNSLIPSLDDYGYSLVVLFDENDKVIYASTYYETKDEVLKKLNAFLN